MYKFDFLLKQSELNLSSYSSWIKQAVSETIQTLQNELFPCVFARRANALENLLFVFVDTKNSKEHGTYYSLDNLLKGLIEYTEFCKKISVKERLYSPLVIILNWQFAILKESQDKAWEILKEIYQYNSLYFDNEVPGLNPEDERWKFRFNGVNLFFNLNHPQHKLHRSRNINSFMTMVVNPSENFSVVAPLVNGERKISNMIRDRVRTYNNGVVPDTLGISDDTKPDWKQYQHEEGDAEIPSICPFSVMER